MGLAFYTWTPEAAADFYRAYLTSFSTRTDTPLDEESWVHHFANPDGEDFQQKISLLVKKDDLPLAFAVCHSGDPSDHDGSKTAWVTQMGVHAGWRRQGIGAAILSELLHRFTKAGFGWASISVNINNPSAKALYEQVGFRRKDRFTMYLKEIEP